MTLTFTVIFHEVRYLSETVVMCKKLIPKIKLLTLFQEKIDVFLSSLSPLFWCLHAKNYNETDVCLWWSYVFISINLNYLIHWNLNETKQLVEFCRLLWDRNVCQKYTYWKPRKFVFLFRQHFHSTNCCKSVSAVNYMKIKLLWLENVCM